MAEKRQFLLYWIIQGGSGGVSLNIKLTSPFKWNMQDSQLFLKQNCAINCLKIVIFQKEEE